MVAAVDIAARRERRRAYYHANRARIAAARRLNYAANKARILAARRAYYQHNKARISAARKAMRAARKEADRAAALEDLERFKIEI